MKKLLTLLLFSQMLFACALKESVTNFFHKKSESAQIIKPVPKPQEDELQASQDFVQGSEDVPLLLGMERISDDSLGFDSAIGSITSISYRSSIEPEKVRDFYVKTLPQMGWKLVSSDADRSTFKREEEKLDIEFLMRDGQHLVQFFLSSSL